MQETHSNQGQLPSTSQSTEEFENNASSRVSFSPKSDFAFQLKPTQRQRPVSRRALRACTRCHVRRTKCDAKRPRCSSCLKAGSECIMPDGFLMTEQDSYNLACRVQWLENILSEAGINASALPTGASVTIPTLPSSPSNSECDESELISSYLREKDLTSYLHALILDFPLPLSIDLQNQSFPENCLPQNHYIGPSSGSVIADCLSREAKRSGFTVTSSFFNKERLFNPILTDISFSETLYLFPDRDSIHLILIAVIHHFVSFPIINLKTLADLFNKVYENGSANSAYQLYEANMCLAIGSSLLGKDSFEYFWKAIQFFSKSQSPYSFEYMRELLYMGIYSLLESIPGLESYGIIRKVGTIAIALGLHREVTYRNSDIPSSLTELMRRCFWSFYALDRLLASTTGRPVGLSDSSIDVQMFSSISDVEENTSFAELNANGWNLELSVHVIHLRRLTSDILNELYQANVTPKKGIQQQLHTKLDEWKCELKQYADASHGSMRTYLELEYLENLMLIYRPTIASTQSEVSACVICLSSASSWIKNAGIIHQRGIPLLKPIIKGIIITAFTLVWAYFTCKEKGLFIFSQSAVVSDVDCAWRSLRSVEDKNWKGISGVIAVLENLRNWISGKTDYEVHMIDDAMTLEEFDIDNHINLWLKDFAGFKGPT
ncbi:fungal specific transcription factor domain-containing protein [Schizosaccharomyces cryophilus OY26]|uniref:Fungal specific transcription factor domain-containing protein n=1 Tax=Schizosaccharomyces cryophilus (strain OY26 / ATCC MYA-4695 / CBS 11777 / NBRC 106824 / NRRL Y48691) TaxID=653667 RepID=S9VQA4_SCHCR|nr:fungal specific transcription factor domain-containing protein [Schizosaccharomyces cryophilus OY26]EPY50148.1 fungal specific transcription factor domain-containing protein [Schizosaccharomyces cryophilus OY26]